jgi:hypothetical protein
MKGQGTYGTGDINLAAALAALGIEPDPIQPIELIARDNGTNYTRFHFSQISPCGKYEVTAMSAAWGDADTFKRENDSHPFSLLMEFIATRPRDCSNQDQWLDHAAQFLVTCDDTAFLHRDWPWRQHACDDLHAINPKTGQ